MANNKYCSFISLITSLVFLHQCVNKIYLFYLDLSHKSMSSVKTKNVEDFSTKLTIFFQITKFFMYKSTKWKYPRILEFQEGIQTKMEIVSLIFAFQVHTVPNKVDQKKVALHGDRPIFLKDKEACIKHVQMIAQTQMNNRSHRKVCFCSPVVSSHIFFLGQPHEKLQTD